MAALALAGVGVSKGTWAVGGSDSSCYALMADAYAHGHLQPSSAMVAEAPWPDAALTLAPGGFIPSPVRRDAASPVCMAGVSALMAPLVAIGGGDALFLFTPVAAGLLVWFAFVLARRLAGGMAGAVSAVLVATSPIVLFQAMQPMNDIVTAALWVAAIAVATGDGLRRAPVSGVLTGLAVFVRPNLVAVGLVVASALIVVRRIESPGLAVRAVAYFTFGALPPVLLLLLSNQALYGHPFAFGYGNSADLFAVAFARDNLDHYSRAMLDTQTLFPVLALAAPLVVAGRQRRAAWLVLAAAAAVVLSYVFYRPFPEWWYLRFLLPAVVLLVVLASVVCVTLAARARMGGAVALGTVVLALFMLRTVGAREAFSLERLEGRFRETGHVVRDRLPERAVLITVFQSGSMRFYASREAVLWDSMDPAWLDRAVDWLSAQGRTPYILLERREESEFRARFTGHSALGALDWPPRFDIHRQVRIFDPADRARFLAGESYPTENIGRPGR